MNENRPTPSGKRHALRSVARALALEPRLLFDGAGAVAAVDQFNAADHAAEAQKQETQPETDARPSEAAEKPAASVPLLDLADNARDYQALLGDAAGLAQQKLVGWLNGDDFPTQAAQIFDADAGSAEWNARLDALRGDILSGRYEIRVEARSGAELESLIGAYNASGSTGRPTLYLNADYLASASAEQVQQVLLEEIGHDIDQRVNGGKDSTGDEGHAFAALLLSGNANLAANAERGDHHTLWLDGQQVAIEAAGNLNIAQIHYVPIPEADIQSALKGIAGASKVSGNIQTVVALSATANGTIVVYDHWEDGYETDINNPVQASTKVWGYNNGEWFNDANGNGIRDGGEALVADGTTIVANGSTLVLKNAVNPSSPTTVDFDGRDKIGSSKAISVTRAGWSTTPGTVLAGAVNLLDAGNAGKEYTLPLGQNLGIAKYFKEGDNGTTATGPNGPTGSNGLFEYTSAHIMATQDNTTVRIDKDGNGTIDITVTLNQGQSYFVNGGLNAGAKITADKGVGVYVIAGDVGSGYENRWVTLTPDEQWSSSYYAPVSTTLSSNPSTIMLYNPNASAITVHYQTAGSTGSITVAAGSSAGFLMPASAAHFYTTGSGSAAAAKFFAIGVIDADATDNATHDWSYSLIPESYLTDRVVVAWAPGADNVTRTLAGSDKNGSPVWVTPTGNTTLYIDSTTVTVKDGAGNTITGTVEGSSTKYNLSKLQSYRVSDADKDQSGLNMYTKDGTLITAAWGEDPSIAGTGAPYLDMGTAVTPYPDYVLTKTSAEAKTATYGTGVSNNNDKIELSEEVVYTVRLTNRAVIDLYNIKLTDAITPADSAEYVVGSTILTVYNPDGSKAWSINGTTQTFYKADGSVDRTVTNATLAGNDFPLAGSGYSIADLDPSTQQIDGLKRGGVVEIQYRVKIRNDINKALADGDYTITNSVKMEGDGVTKDKVNKTLIEVKVTDGEVFLMKGDFSEAAVTYQANQTVGLRVVDGDQNKNNTAAETLTVLVTNTTTGETETVTLTETGVNTGIFQGTLTTTTAASGNNNGTLNVATGNAIKVEYTDPMTGQSGTGAGFDNPDNPGITGPSYQTGNSNRKTATIAAAPPPPATDGLVEFLDGSFTTNKPNFKEGDSLGIRVTDGDQNKDAAVAETLTVVVTNSTTGEKETVTLIETGVNTGIFQGTLPTGATVVKADNDGTLKMVFGDSIKVDYTDPVTGATADNPANPGTNQNTDTFTVTKIKTLYLSSDGTAGDASGDLDRIDPVHGTDGTTDTTTDLASGLVLVAGSDSAQTANGSSLTFVHDPTASGDNKMLLVAVAVGNTGSTGTPPNVTGVTFDGGAMTLVATVTSGNAGSAPGSSDQNVRIFLYRLDNPGSAAKNVVVTLSGAGSIVAGAVTFKGVNMDNPLSEVVTKRSTGNATSNNLTIDSNSNEVVFGVGAWDESGSLTIPSGQTQIIKSSGGYVTSAISWQQGASTVTHGYSGGPDQDHALLAVAIRPANFAVFTQGIALADDLKIPAAGAIKVVTHVNADVTGLVDGVRSVNATLTYGGTTIANLGDATYDSTAGTLTWVGEAGGAVNIPSGSNIKLTITNNESGSKFKIDYDSQTAPSRIELPTTTVIKFADVDTATTGEQFIGFFDKPYSDASSKQIVDGTATAGQTVYVRVKVSDPFGDYDISSLNLDIDGPETDGDKTLTLTNANVVDANDNGRYKIYEYAWTTIDNTGSYTVKATANEGSEGVNVVISGNVDVSARDLGTPSITEFIKALNGADAGPEYTVGHDAFLRVTDLDEAGKSTVKAKVNGIEVTLTETATAGVFEADLSLQNAAFNNLPTGTVLSASYKDVDDDTDTSNDSISVPIPANTAPVATNQARSISENQTATGTNLITSNEGSGVDSDANGDTLTVIAINGDSGSVGSQITLPSGAKLTVNANGSYSYDPNRVFDYLTGGQQATDSFTYTISDGKGGTSTATVTITINGLADPTINVTDHNGTGTLGDNSIAENATAPVTGQFTLNAPYGLKEIGIGTTPVTVTAAALAALGTTPVVINTNEGTLTLTGYNTGTGVVSYSYRQTGTSRSHNAANDNWVDKIALTITDLADTTAAGRLDILITDTVPAAVADSKTVTEGATLTVNAANGVLGNDSAGADGWASGGAVVGVKTGAGGTPTTGVGTQLTGSYGKLTLNTDGSYTYVSTADSTTVDVQDVFTYTVRDADGDEATTTLTINITNINNRPPVATDDTRSTPEDTPLTGNLLTNDSDPDGDTLTVTKITIAGVDTPVPSDGTEVEVSITGKGKLKVKKTGEYTFTPEPDWHGTVPPIAYTINDGKGANNSTGTGELKITVTPVVDIANDSSSTHVNVPVTTPVLGNDTFAGTPAITATTPPANGSITVNAGGSITYTPKAGWTGTDSYTYTVTSGGVTETATVTVTVSNTPPTANNDVRSTPEDTPVSGNVLTGTGGDVADSDPNGDPLTVTHVKVGADETAVPTNGTPATLVIAGSGTLVIDKSGSYTFTPLADWNGTVLPITYTVSDGTGATNSTAQATLTITVTPVADVANDSSSTHVNVPVTTNVLGNDTFAGTPAITATTPPANGSITVNAGGTITYTPKAGWTGTDSYTYTVTSGGVTETATVTVTVSNTPPTANNDVRSTAEDTPVSGNVLTGTGGDVADSDPNADPLTVTHVKVGADETAVPTNGTPATLIIAGSGTLVIDKTGHYTFTPLADWNGTVPPIIYTVSDGTGATNGTAQATLAITVTPVADIANDKVETLGDQPVTTPVMGNDGFANPDRTVTATTPPANGTVTINPDGSITYRPNAGWSGADSYTYTVTSGGVTETATVTVTVVPLPVVPPPPVTPLSLEPEDPDEGVRLQPQAPLQPRNVLDLSPVVLDAGPYFGSERHGEVRRMVLPFHPIVYVNREVVVSQEERALGDMRSFSQPGVATPGELALSSLGSGLAEDHSLFVVHAVRGAQHHSSSLGSSVDGRYGRIDLGSDGMLPGASQFHGDALPSWAKVKPKAAEIRQAGDEAPDPRTTAADDAAGKGDAGERAEASENALPAQVAAHKGQARVASGAPSFAEQLRGGANRLPLAARRA